MYITVKYLPLISTVALNLTPWCAIFILIIVFNIVPTFQGVHSASNTQWREVQLSIPPLQTLFGFGAIRGGSTESEDQGDICIDDVTLLQEKCGIYTIFSWLFGREGTFI